MASGLPQSDNVSTPAAGFLAQVRRSAVAQRRAMDKAINKWNAAAPPDCQLAVDSDLLSGGGLAPEARRFLYSRGWRHAYLLAVTLGDHLMAVGDMAMSAEGPRTFAPMTVARAALEAAARIDYLLCPRGDLRDRILRAAAVLSSSAEEELKAVAEFERLHPAVFMSAKESAEGRRAEIEGHLVRAGIVAARDRQGFLRAVSWAEPPQDRTETNLNLTRLLRDLLPTKPAAYRVGSGVVHGQPWILDNDEALNAAARTLNWPPDPTTFAAALDLAISASVIALEAFAALLGQDPRRERTEAQRREEAVSRILQQAPLS